MKQVKIFSHAVGAYRENVVSELVERVAMAIAGEWPNSRLTKWEDCAEEFKEARRREASAAISAMREPTMDMESAASNWQGAQMTYSDVWRAMIDEALK